MKAHGLKYSALKMACFSIVEDERDKTLGPIIVWIAIYPNTTNAGAVHDATPDILHILADVQITNIAIEQYRGSAIRLVGPPLMSVEHNTSPEFGLNHPFNTATNYEFNGANPQHILVCGDHHLTDAITEIQNAITTELCNVIKLAGEVKDLELKLGMPKENQEALRSTKLALNKKNKVHTTLQSFLARVNVNWQDNNSHRFSVSGLHLASPISLVFPYFSTSLDNRSLHFIIIPNHQHSFSLSPYLIF